MGSGREEIASMRTRGEGKTGGIGVECHFRGAWASAGSAVRWSKSEEQGPRR